jgi:hypothetical protein
MTNRLSYSPQDFEKKCKQAERDHEAQKLELLLERVRRQIAQRDNPIDRVDGPKPPVMAIRQRVSGAGRASLFER